MVSTCLLSLWCEAAIIGHVDFCYSLLPRVKIASGGMLSTMRINVNLVHRLLPGVIWVLLLKKLKILRFRLEGFIKLTITWILVLRIQILRVSTRAITLILQITRVWTLSVTRTPHCLILTAQTPVLRGLWTLTCPMIAINIKFERIIRNLRNIVNIRAKKHTKKSLLKPIPPDKYDGTPDTQLFHKFMTQSMAYLEDGNLPKHHHVYILSNFLTDKVYTFIHVMSPVILNDGTPLSSLKH